MTKNVQLIEILNQAVNKCSDRSMEVKLPALIGNYDRKTNQQTNGQTGSEGSYTSNKQ